MDNAERTQQEPPGPEAQPQEEGLTDLEPLEGEADGVTGGAYEAYIHPSGTKQGRFK